MVAAITSEAEYQAATSGAAWADLSGREHLDVTGPDRVSFLQGMVTNDVEKLPEGQSLYAAMLTPKGAMVADLRVLKRPDALWLDLEASLGAKALEFLNKYLISEEAELVQSNERAMVTLLGPEASALLDKLDDLALSSMPGLLGQGSLDVLVRRDSWAEVEATLGAQAKISAATLEVLRVEAGVPKYFAELVETTIPLEANLDKAIHYQKGCYIGQEVIARATHRGHMNRKLTGLLLGESEAEAKAELFKAGKKVGWLTTVARSPKKQQVVALGYVHRDALAEGEKLDVGAGPAVATVTALPF
jgi:folate-binding protein YgfZ